MSFALNPHTGEPLFSKTFVLKYGISGTGRKRNIPLPPGDAIIQVKPEDTPAARMERRIRFRIASCPTSKIVCADGICACVGRTPKS